MDTIDFVGLAGVPIVIALTALVLRTVALKPRYKPACSWAVGVLWNVGLAWGVTHTPLPQAAVVGCLVGLVASGLYTAGKAREKE